MSVKLKPFPKDRTISDPASYGIVTCELTYRFYIGGEIFCPEVITDIENHVAGCNSCKEIADQSDR